MEKGKGREIGYYCVIFKGVNMVAEWRSHGYWYICGSSTAYKDNDFDAIGELIHFENKK